MGQKLVSEIIFQPPKGVDMVCINNTHYTTTSNNRKIPLLLFEYNSSIIYQPNLDHQLSQYNDQNKTGIEKEIYTNLGIEIKTDIKKERKARTTKNESETEILLTNKNDEVSKENGKKKKKKKKKKKEIKQQKK